MADLLGNGSNILSPPGVILASGREDLVAKA